MLTLLLCRKVIKIISKCYKQITQKHLEIARYHECIENERLLLLGFHSDHLTISHRHDVPNVNFLPSTGADTTLRTSSPQCHRKYKCEGVLYYYAGRHERVNLQVADSTTTYHFTCSELYGHSAPPGGRRLAIPLKTNHRTFPKILSL